MTRRGAAFRDIGRVLKQESHFTMTTEGPAQFPEFLRRFAVYLASGLLKPPGLKLDSRLTIEDPSVYDKFILTYKKQHQHEAF